MHKRTKQSNRTQKKNSAQGTNVTKNPRKLKENRAQDTNVTIKQNSQKTVRKTLA